MTAISLTATSTTRAASWLTAVALVVAALVVTVWVVARMSTSTGNSVAPAHQTAVQPSQNQLCVPAPGTRFC